MGTPFSRLRRDYKSDFGVPILSSQNYFFKEHTERPMILHGHLENISIPSTMSLIISMQPDY
jgi:hypothetical protein